MKMQHELQIKEKEKKRCRKNKNDKTGFRLVKYYDRDRDRRAVLPIVWLDDKRAVYSKLFIWLSDVFNETADIIYLAGKFIEWKKNSAMCTQAV